MGPDSRLKTLVDRLGNQLSRELDSLEVKTREARRRGIDLLSKEIDPPAQKPAQPAPLTRREEKELAREDRRANRRREEREQATIPGGVFMLVFSAFLVIFAGSHPEFFWLIFVALGVGGKGAQQLGFVAERRRSLSAAAEPRPALPASGPHEVDVVCDQLLAELASSPEAVRDFLQNPEQTVESLRSTSKALDARRRQLKSEGYDAQLTGLETQRTDLLGRRELATDSIARTRLNSAIESLDNQANAVRQLVAATERVDGEYTSLLVLLQELRTRVAVARSTTSSTQLGGLRANVERLNDELEAITDAMKPQTPERLTGS